MKRWFYLPILLSVFVLQAQAENCIVNDDEEYVVFAAVLFPNKPEISEGFKTREEREAHLASAKVRLDGFEGSSYTLRAETSPAQMSEDPDPALVADFNTKNKLACTLNKSKLLSHVSGRGTLDFRSAEVKQDGEIKEGRNQLSRAGGAAFLSRPGFNKARNKAVVEAGFIADYEMGVAYRVYLEKSPKTGKWIITGADRNRMY